MALNLSIRRVRTKLPQQVVQVQLLRVKTMSNQLRSRGVIGAVSGRNGALNVWSHPVRKVKSRTVSSSPLTKCWET